MSRMKIMKLNRRIFEKLLLSFIQSKTTDSLGFPNGKKSEIKYNYSNKFNDKGDLILRLTISNKDDVFFISKYRHIVRSDDKESINKLEEMFFENIVDVIFKKSMNSYMKT